MMKTEEIAYSPSHFISGWRFKAMIIMIILNMIGYLCVTFWGGWHDVAQAVLRVGFIGIVLSLLLSLINYYLRFIRWEVFLGVLGHHLPGWPNFLIYMSGFSLTTTPGKAGEALRSVFLKNYGIPYRQSFGAFLAERVSDLIAVLLLAFLGLWIYPHSQPVVIAVALLVLAVLTCIQKQSWLKGIENVAKKILPKRFLPAIEFFIETMLAFKSCFEMKVLLYGIGLGTVAWAAEGLALHYILHFLGYDIGIASSFFIYGFSLLIGSITFLPGGLGGTEATMLHLLMQHNIPTSAAVAATIVIRLATLWFAVVLGLIALPKKQITTERL